MGKHAPKRGSVEAQNCSNGIATKNGRTKIDKGSTAISSLLILGVGFLVLVAAALFSFYGSSPSKKTSLLELLEPLKRGECTFGTIADPGAVASASLADLADFRFPGGLRCPLLVHGLADGLKPGAWESVARLGDLAELEKNALSKFAFDASSTGLFAYWDNASLLAKDAMHTGQIRQSYTKMILPKAAFFEAARKSAASDLGFVRYGGSIRTFAPRLEDTLKNALDSLAPKGESQSSISRSFWVSSAGSFSTAHYDSFENAYVMVRGEKLALLAPPADAPFFEVYAGTHPLARQARRHFGHVGVERPSGKDDGSLLPTGARVLQANIKAGTMLFIPAGWFHHLVALQLSVSAALTVLPQEHTVYNSWANSGTENLLPFLRGDTGSWSSQRIVGVLRAYAPALLSELGQVTNLGDPLKLFVNASYSKHVHAELGLPRRRFRCGKPPVAADIQLARDAAVAVAQHFVQYFREDQRLSYLMAYFETIFSKVATGDTVAAIMSEAAAFVQTCLIDKPVDVSAY